MNDKTAVLSQPTYSLELETGEVISWVFDRESKSVDVRIVAPKHISQKFLEEVCQELDYSLDPIILDNIIERSIKEIQLEHLTVEQFGKLLGIINSMPTYKIITNSRYTF